MPDAGGVLFPSIASLGVASPLGSPLGVIPLLSEFAIRSSTLLFLSDGESNSAFASATP